MDSQDAQAAKAEDEAANDDWPWPQYPRGAKRVRDYYGSTSEPGAPKGSTLTTGWEGDFLEAYRRTGIIAAACRRARLTTNMVKYRRQVDPEFRVAFDEATEEAIDTLEAAAVIRARDGVTRQRGIYYQGEMVGQEEIVEYSDSLLKFLLEHKRPSVYRETIDVNHNITVMKAEIDKIAIAQGWDEDTKRNAVEEAMKLMGL